MIGCYKIKGETSEEIKTKILDNKLLGDEVSKLINSLNHLSIEDTVNVISMIRQYYTLVLMEKTIQSEPKTHHFNYV